MSDKRNKKLKLFTIILATALTITAVTIIVLYKRYQKFLRSQVIKEVTIESGTPVNLQDFFTVDAPNPEFVTDISTIDTTIPQSYIIDVKTGKYHIDIVEKVTLNIVDTTPPVGEAVPQNIYWDMIPDAKDVVTNVYDLAPVEISYVEPMGNETTSGERDIPVRIADAYGNETIINVPFTIVYDPEPPVIKGTQDIEAFIGDIILYRDGVTVTDNYDKNPQLEIDTSEVDPTKEGVYQVTYIATDDHGNTSSVSIKLSLRVMPERYYDPEEIYALARDVIERNHICTDDMSDMQKTVRIFDWISQHMAYIRDTDRCDWTAGAYDGLTTFRGDCYNYMAVAHAMLGAVGIESICLERYPVKPTPHFWNLVKIDGKWYHCDSCLAPDMETPYNFICLYTENEVRWWNYNYDHDVLPEGAVLATESIQWKLNYYGVPLRELPEEEEETPVVEVPIENEPVVEEPPVPVEEIEEQEDAQN